MGDGPDLNDPGQQQFSKGLYPEAIATWTAAAAHGEAGAAHRLGVEYMDGKPGVVQRDYAKAMQYHLQAAAAGNPLSMFDIGSMYEYAFGVPKDLALAAKWYGYSANYGLAQGQYNYATMLEAGDGVPKDEVEAYKFFICAARGGFTGVPYNNDNLRIDRNAPLPTQLLERKLNREQIADGRQRADSFHKATGPLKVE
ncbi:MAG: sel1 repeat family protein [Alphaproteobacteria bacterium]|nr:sel1 repeat family protein [Alphaproteobacteria bacterium]